MCDLAIPAKSQLITIVFIPPLKEQGHFRACRLNHARDPLRQKSLQNSR